MILQIRLHGILQQHLDSIDAIAMRCQHQSRVTLLQHIDVTSKAHRHEGWKCPSHDYQVPTIDISLVFY